MHDIKIALLGLGNVGMGVYNIIKTNGDKILHSDGIRLNVEKILVRDITKKRKVEVDQKLFTNSIEDIVNNQEITIVAEFMGGIDPAKDYIIAALKNKKTVVTANKEVVAKYWHELERVAQENGVGLYYEASVAGGIPIIKVINESLQANSISEMMGIINGTTNFILTKMSENGRDYNEVLEEAKRLGYAEPDPTADVEGYDAVYKLSILSSLAFHSRIHIENIYRQGISCITIHDINYGHELGYVIKLLAVGKKNGNVIVVRVHPTFIPKDHPLAAVRDSYNAIFIKGDAVGNLMLYGRGAGDLPTGSAILSDIITASKRSSHPYTTFDNEEFLSPQVVINDNWESKYFIRLTVDDKPGVLAKIAGIFGNHGVSISSVIQKGHTEKNVPLIFVTHYAKELSMKDAIEDINKETDVIRVENVIRVEE